MSKYYVTSGNVSVICSTNVDPMTLCLQIMEVSEEGDVFGEYFYVDERGYRDSETSQEDTIVLPTKMILSQE